MAPRPRQCRADAALLELPLAQFQAHVSGICEGQALRAVALRVSQIICVDPTLNRRELARLVCSRISRLPERDLWRPARVFVFRALLEAVPCPGFRWEDGG